METDNLNNTEVESAEEYQGEETPPQPTSQGGDIYVLLCHVAAPIIWPWKRKLSQAVDLHGRAALNHMISCVGLFIVVNIILWALLKIGLISSHIATLIRLPILLGSIGYSIFGLIKAESGALIRYPFPFRWVERLFNLTEIQQEDRSASDTSSELDD